ncbi:XdhC/CoxI family protein [Pseudomonas sp. SO81]|uniref:XdhC family protein n=1 Tax=Pseudomonas sp. SO81 TaxID=2983246 RepID=UPI0025A4A53C|nr:XdhC/CoxI family protein [Pseudomonas sp. SO81]WJN60751.1 Xanthine and CO maturation factor, XdhC/CoxF family [Pseudomonas sp. SO81]
MSDVGNLLDALEELAIQKQEAVLATVVKVEGSAYRRPGARMLIPQIGNAVGTVSGGCLESDLAKKAWWLTEQGQPVIRTYSTGMPGDEAGEEEELAFGLGCNGTVHILLERVRVAQPYLPAQLLRQVIQEQRPATLATVIAGTGDAKALIGARVALSPMDDLFLSGNHAALADLLTVDLQAAFDQRKTALHRYDLGADEIEVVIEYLAPPRKLVIFGAGHDAQPLVAMAKQQGWRVTVIDSRSHFARNERFPGADQVLHLSLETGQIPSGLIAHAAVIVMSHSYSQDRHWLAQALSQAPSYIGQLGPRSRTERLLAEIPNSLSMPAFEKLHYPMGLDLGGDTPESIALSLVAEVTAHFNGRNGGMLRERTAPIHDAEPVMRHQKASESL